MTKPTDTTLWATDGAAVKTAPSGAKKILGWIKEKMPFEWLNWILYTNELWLQWTQSHAIGNELPGSNASNTFAADAGIKFGTEPTNGISNPGLNAGPRGQAWLAHIIGDLNDLLRHTVARGGTVVSSPTANLTSGNLVDGLPGSQNKYNSGVSIPVTGVQLTVTAASGFKFEGAFSSWFMPVISLQGTAQNVRDQIISVEVSAENTPDYALTLLSTTALTPSVPEVIYCNPIQVPSGTTINSLKVVLKLSATVSVVLVGDLRVRKILLLSAGAALHQAMTRDCVKVGGDTMRGTLQIANGGNLDITSGSALINGGGVGIQNPTIQTVIVAEAYDGGAFGGYADVMLYPSGGANGDAFNFMAQNKMAFGFSDNTFLGDVAPVFLSYAYMYNAVAQKGIHIGDPQAGADGVGRSGRAMVSDSAGTYAMAHWLGGQSLDFAGVNIAANTNAQGRKGNVVFVATATASVPAQARSLSVQRLKIATVGQTGRVNIYLPTGVTRGDVTIVLNPCQPRHVARVLGGPVSDTVIEIEVRDWNVAGNPYVDSSFVGFQVFRIR